MRRLQAPAPAEGCVGRHIFESRLLDNDGIMPRVDRRRRATAVDAAFCSLRLSPRWKLWLSKAGIYVLSGFGDCVRDETQ